MQVVGCRVSAEGDAHCSGSAMSPTIASACRYMSPERLVDSGAVFLRFFQVLLEDSKFYENIRGSSRFVEIRDSTRLCEIPRNYSRSF